MPSIQISATWNKENSPLLVLAIKQGFFVKHECECVYGIIPLSSAKIKFLRKISQTSNSLGTTGSCGEPVQIKARDWSFIWDQELDMKIDATYWCVTGDSIYVACHNRKGKQIGQTVDLNIRELAYFDNAPVIWHDSEDSNNIINYKFGHNFAKESFKRLKKAGLSLPKSLKLKSNSEINSMLLGLNF